MRVEVLILPVSKVPDACFHPLSLLPACGLLIPDTHERRWSSYLHYQRDIVRLTSILLPSFFYAPIRCLKNFFQWRILWKSCSFSAVYPADQYHGDLLSSDLFCCPSERCFGRLVPCYYSPIKGLLLLSHRWHCPQGSVPFPRNNAPFFSATLSIFVGSSMGTCTPKDIWNKNLQP